MNWKQKLNKLFLKSLKDCVTDNIMTTYKSEINTDNRNALFYVCTVYTLC